MAVLLAMIIIAMAFAQTYLIRKISSDEEIEGVVKDVALKVELEDSNIEEDLKEDPD